MDFFDWKLFSLEFSFFFQNGNVRFLFQVLNLCGALIHFKSLNFFIQVCLILIKRQNSYISYWIYFEFIILPFAKLESFSQRDSLLIWRIQLHLQIHFSELSLGWRAAEVRPLFIRHSYWERGHSGSTAFRITLDGILQLLDGMLQLFMQINL